MEGRGGNSFFKSKPVLLVCGELIIILIKIHSVSLRRISCCAGTPSSTEHCADALVPWAGALNSGLVGRKLTSSTPRTAHCTLPASVLCCPVKELSWAPTACARLQLQLLLKASLWPRSIVCRALLGRCSGQASHRAGANLIR